MSKQTEKNSAEVRHGLIISYFGNSVAVEADDGQVFQCHLHRNQALPVVGDEVHWQLEKGETGTVLTILPRRSLLSRGDGHQAAKPIAANIDVMLIVMAPQPIFSEYLVDRYLVAAELLGISPVLVLNKIDLMSEEVAAEMAVRLAPYRALYPVVLSSIYRENGLDELAHVFDNKSGVLVGPSGVGKSSIITALGGDASIRVGIVSPKGTGKHTTTATRLYHLPQGGRLIDSPGVREFNLWAIKKGDVLRGFKEFRAVKGDCKFRDCQHVAEPSCVVRTAVDGGEISAERYKNYQTLMKLAVK